MIFTPLVVGEPGAAERLDNRRFVNMSFPVLAGSDGEDARLQGRERHANIASREPGETIDLGVGHLGPESRQAAFVILQGPAEQGGDLLLVERVQDHRLAAGEQRGVDLEGGVLGRRADQGDGAVLDGRQEGVLLALVEAVDLVDEQERVQEMTPRVPG